MPCHPNIYRRIESIADENVLPHTRSTRINWTKTSKKQHVSTDNQAFKLYNYLYYVSWRRVLFTFFLITTLLILFITNKHYSIQSTIELIPASKLKRIPFDTHSDLPSFMVNMSSDVFLKTTLCGGLISNSSNIKLSDISKTEKLLREKYKNICNLNYINMSCSKLINLQAFHTQKLRKFELKHPHAFTILLQKNLYQFQVLFRILYSKQNYYCIHVDLEASDCLVQYATKLSQCLKNVFVSLKRFNVTLQRRFSILQAELTCQIHLLKKSDKWKYYMILSGQDLPIQTGYTRTQILSLLNNSNSVQSIEEIHQSDTKKSLKSFTVYKGSFHSILTRSFLESIHKSETAYNILKHLRDAQLSHEYFYPALNRHQEFPGTGQLTEHLLSHYVQYKSQKGIFHLTWEDLPLIEQSKRLFAGEFDQQFDSVAIDCLEQWLKVKALNPVKINIKDYKLYIKRIKIRQQLNRIT
ncbi:unnamed protein product [Didymodactylos carnosus]|uniref:Uncharacterized protein n=1 Tax=Didymodactylos carnosus TaxID=1234261 RepID=A0A8S2ETN7_9BILA|nr:unnamed protein product [Didymodactylos carnosus]CAF4064330.1 unnamed protein product [Didymodactylos carnosus]